MRHTLWLGRWCSFPVGLHWSWFLAATFVTVTIASTIDAPRIVAFGVAAGCALVLFGSVLVHEMGHAAVARREGLATNGIVLFAFGGVATLASEPPSAGAELRIALAGPAVSGVLAAFALLALATLERTGGGSAARYIAAYGSLANASLAIFNLLPAFPMDGGRAFRALLWHVGRRRGLATRRASYAGVAFAACFVVAGVLGAALQSAPRLLWLVGIGVFLAHQCRLQLAEARIAERLEAVGVREMMERAAGDDDRVASDAVLTGGASALDAVSVFRSSDRLRIAVVDGDRLEGWLRRGPTLALLDAA